MLRATFGEGRGAIRFILRSGGHYPKTVVTLVNAILG